MAEFYNRLLYSAKQYFSFREIHRCSFWGSKRLETLLIPVAWNYKSVLSRLPFSGNRAVGDYRCEEQISVLDLLSFGLDNFSIYKDIGKEKYPVAQLRDHTYCNTTSYNKILIPMSDNWQFQTENTFSLKISSWPNIP